MEPISADSLTVDNRIQETLYKKHQTLILPEKSYFIRNKFRSDFHYVSYKYVSHLLVITNWRTL